MSTAKEPLNKTYFGIQALRAVAALLVVVRHTCSFWNEKISRGPANHFEWSQGDAGVDIFFVISGFVMMGTAPGLAGLLHKGRIFLWRRLVRIVPLYWLLTTVQILWLQYGHPSDGQTIGGVWRAVASYLFIPTSDFYGRSYPVLGVGWTLNFEMMFYLLFALALAWEIAPLVFLVPTLAFIAAVGCLRQDSWPAYTFLLSPFVLEFLGGALIAHFTLRNRLPQPWVGTVMLIGGFVTLLAVPEAGAVFTRVLCWGLPACALVLGTVVLEDQLRPKLPRWLLEAGNASYAIYLLHLFIVSVVWRVFARAGAAEFSGLILMIVVMLGLSLLAGEVVHRAVELPLIRILRGKRVPGVSVLPLKISSS